MPVVDLPRLRNSYSMRMMYGEVVSQERGRTFVEAFISKIGLILRGTTSAPAARFGETLQEEHIRGGAFAASDSASQKRALGMSNANMRLYGGAQYNRAMAEFRCAAATPFPTSSPRVCLPLEFLT